MIRLYKNARIICDSRIIDGLVISENGRISEICERSSVEADETVDCRGNFLSPGFADIHVHGGGGYSAMSENAEDIIAMAEAHAAYGTTSIVPTTLAAPVEQLQKCMDTVSEAKNKCAESNILGIHLEGPFISMSKKGAQSPDNILPATDENIHALLDYSDDILIIGAAPETENGMAVGEYASKKGITASVAHTDADFETVEKALAHGYSDITHIFSAMSAMHKEGIFRKVGAAEAGLALDGYTAQFIGDLRHLPAGAIKLIYKCKGAEKAYAITDGLEYSASEIKEGTLIKQENGLEVLYEDGVMKLGDRSCLAGSTATMNVILKNLVEFCGIPLTDAVKMCSDTPLSVVGYSDRKGRIAPGYDEDIVIFDDDIKVLSVFVNGKSILRKS